VVRKRRHDRLPCYGFQSRDDRENVCFGMALCVTVGYWLVSLRKDPGLFMGMLRCIVELRPRIMYAGGRIKVCGALD